MTYFTKNILRLFFFILRKMKSFEVVGDQFVVLSLFFRCSFDVLSLVSYTDERNAAFLVFCSFVRASFSA